MNHRKARNPSVPETLRKERRSDQDILVMLIRIMIVTCGSLLIAAMLLLDRAKPRIETFFDRLLDVQLRKNWDLDLLVVHMYVVASLCLMSGAGLLCNSLRARRKTDRYSRTLIFSIIFAAMALLFSLMLLPAKAG